MLPQKSGAARCPDCHTRVTMVRMENDRWIAIDKQATIDGTVCLVRDRDTGEVTGRYAKEAESALRYQPHVRTCSGFRWQR